MTESEIQAIHRRMDKHDEILMDIRDKVNEHINSTEEMLPAVRELVSMWRGSKLIMPILLGAIAMVAAVWTWAEDHLK